MKGSPEGRTKNKHENKQASALQAGSSWGTASITYKPILPTRRCPPLPARLLARRIDERQSNPRAARGRPDPHDRRQKREARHDANAQQAATAAFQTFTLVDSGGGLSRVLRERAALASCQAGLSPCTRCRRALMRLRKSAPHEGQMCEMQQDLAATDHATRP
jgi:hypothetical protein